MKEYIEKVALVREIEKQRNAYISEPGKYRVLSRILSLIDTLEVKEVDLEKEIDDYMNEHFSECGDGVLISDANSTELTLLDATSIARHFYELGLKGQLKNK